MNPLLRVYRFARPYWARSSVAMVLLIVLVFLDLAIPRLVQQIIDEGIAQQDLGVVIRVSLVMIGITVISTLIAVGNNVFSVRVGECVARDLREALFLQVQDFSYANLDGLPTGQLMVRMSSDTRAVQTLVQITLRIGTRAPLLMIGSLVLMFATSPTLALYLLPLLVVTAGLIVWFIFKTEPLFGSVQEKLDRLNMVLQENIGGARLVKAFARAEHEGERFEAANASFADQSIAVMRLLATMSPALTMCVNLGLVLILWVGGVRAIDDQLTVGQIVAFTNYLLTTMAPLVMMTRLSNVWATGLVSANRIGEVLDVDPTVQDAPDARALPPDSPGRIVFEHVSFHYAGSQDAPVLRDLDFSVDPGETVAILGSTGAGKTTLVHLLPRFYDAVAGRVLVDGQDVRELQQASLLALIAMVPQESILFSGSVRDNIRYGAPESTDEAVVAAARAAQAHDFILELPDGYDTHVEERGVNLSGGQKQRLAIARALIMQPRILILDDATSAVDVETETRIQDALAALPVRPTSIVVAQRISTVLHADSIMVLDEGRMVARGTHQELMAQCTVYREIYDSQLGNGPQPGPKPGATP